MLLGRLTAVETVRRAVKTWGSENLNLRCVPHSQLLAESRGFVQKMLIICGKYMTQRGAGIRDAIALF